MRLSRIHRNSSSAEDAIPTRRLVLWAVVGVALVVGLVLYFVYERQIAPLVA